MQQWVMDGDAPPVESHQYAGPTAADSLASLTRVVGEERAGVLWSDARHAAGLGRAPASLSPDELHRVAEALVAEGGAVATVARAIQIRLRTYQRLAARAASLEPAQ